MQSSATSRLSASRGQRIHLEQLGVVLAVGAIERGQGLGERFLVAAEAEAIQHRARGVEVEASQDVDT